MIISKTPYRISFFGGGTDYPSWYRREGGAVLSTTIDKYCYISCRVLPPFFDVRHRIVWSHIETVSSISEILHPAVREGLRHLGFDDSLGLEIHHQGDLPARAGMGSSSAFVVGLIQVALALRGRRLEPDELARSAIELEQDVLKENVGCQDQIASAYGGMNRIKFATDGSFEVQRVTASPERLQDLAEQLVLVYTGHTRLATEIAASVLSAMQSKELLLREMRGQVDEGWKILHRAGELSDFGRLLHETWVRKRELSPRVSSPEIDAIYERARQAGALGGKLLGAGGAGFMVLFVPRAARAEVEKALASLVLVPFGLETRGSELLPLMAESEPTLPPR